MTKAGFEKLLTLLEGGFLQKLTAPQRDAWWELLHEDRDEDVLREAKAYLRDPERCRFGFPKPGDLLRKPKPADSLPPGRSEQERETSREEARRAVQGLRNRFGLRVVPLRDKPEDAA
ncbi:MAG TPA: hypothetical protein VNH84_05675 [Candidatus Saccharimonadales bacterium]|nr:hypothetical protein [Candidatus Saccharimonadales bacterium]